MSIKLRLALAFTAAAAILFTLGSWLLIAGLSSSLLSSIDSQLAARLSTASRYLPGHAGTQPVPGPPLPVSTLSRSSTRPAGCAEAAPTPAGVQRSLGRSSPRRDTVS